ncbi:hypothetical protein C6495_03980 [Candidatus Poribacteria bacterium]|nr:MAG: hypothetical protein C6495_03980 [Candidatus Poribacteria bacterium]
MRFARNIRPGSVGRGPVPRHVKSRGMRFAWNIRPGSVGRGPSHAHAHASGFPSPCKRITFFVVFKEFIFVNNLNVHKEK